MIIKILYLFFFKRILNSRKQINRMANPAKKLKSESSFKLRKESLLDKTAISISVIPRTEISEAGNGFFIRFL